MNDPGNNHNEQQLQAGPESADTGDNAGSNRRGGPSVVDKFVIRLPQGLRDQIRELSENNRRSMNSEIIMVLEQYIQQHATTASDNVVDHGLSGTQSASAKSEQVTEEPSLDEKLKSLPPEKKAALLSLLT